MCLCVLPEAAAGPGQASGVDSLGRGAFQALGRSLPTSLWSCISPWSSSPSWEVPPHLSSRPPQVALATFEPSLFVKVISFGLSRLGRFPGTAKPKAKPEQGTRIPLWMGKFSSLFFL